MGVGGDFVTVRHFEPDGEIAGRSHGVAFQNGELRSRRQEWRGWAVLHLIGSESVLRLGRLRCKHCDCNRE
jgi:hypothetical protein